MDCNFDDLMTIQRLIELYSERGLERTENDVRGLARTVMRKRSVSFSDALCQIEDQLLSRNPNPEKWD